MSGYQPQDQYDNNSDSSESYISPTPPVQSSAATSVSSPSASPVRGRRNTGSYTTSSPVLKKRLSYSQAPGPKPAPATMGSLQRSNTTTPAAPRNLEAEIEILTAQLDVLRGYAKDEYAQVPEWYGGRRSAFDVEKRGWNVVKEPVWNKGTSFTPAERLDLGLTGLIPHVMEDSSIQQARALKMIQSRSTPLDKYLYLSSLKASNTDLFYRLLMDNAKLLMPLVYTPTIGDVCINYSHLYTRPEALYISLQQRRSLRAILKSWPYPTPSICVVTDGSRILGLGDLGLNGVGIPIGKLALYVSAAGIYPQETMPVVLDVGTDNAQLLRDPLYLGLRQKRAPKNVAREFMDEFMAACRDVFPRMVVQFEDFETEKAFDYLERYRSNYTCFNDDIQGTGAVVLAGYMNAVKLSGVPLAEQRLVFMGAGSAGVGVAKQLVEFYVKQGMSEKDAKAKFWLVDTKGLVTKDRGDTLAAHKHYFARVDNGGHQFRSLEQVIEYVRPTALVGLAATHGVFTESIVRGLKASVDALGAGHRPILFPLSNPLSKAECTFQQAVDWTDGTVIFASGSPFDTYTSKLTGETYQPGQGNNVYIFPGLGLGTILAKASRVTDEMVYSSAVGLSGALNGKEVGAGLIYPGIERVREASVVVAREVMKAARREGVSRLDESLWLEWQEWGDVVLDRWIRERVYDPKF